MIPAEHQWQAFAEDGSPGFGAELTVQEGRITLDETWAPYIQGQLTIALPDEEALEALDPHNDGRVTIIPSSTTVEAVPSTRTSTFSLGVRKRVVRRRQREVELTLASDEAILQDYRKYTDSSHGYGTLYGMVYNVIHDVLPGASVSVGSAASAIGAADVPSGLSFLSDHSIWEHLSPYITGAGGRLFCDGSRQWILDTALPDNTATAAISYLENLIEVEVTTDRGGDWADALGIQYADALTYRTPAGYSKGLLFTRPTDYVDYTETDQLLEERKKAGQTMTVTAAADYTVEPGMELTLTEDADTTPLVAAISAVDFQFPACTMIVTPRADA